MPQNDPRTLVSTEWLETHLNDPDLRILDASWFLPTEDRDPRAEFGVEHIPGARFFDIDEIADLRSDLPHMVPPIEVHVAGTRYGSRGWPSDRGLRSQWHFLSTAGLVVV